MKRLEFVARRLAVKDGLDPDALAFDARIEPWRTNHLAMLPSSIHQLPVWTFYMNQAFDAIEASETYMAFNAEQTARIEDYANGRMSGLGFYTADKNWAGVPKTKLPIYGEFPEATP